MPRASWFCGAPRYHTNTPTKTQRVQNVRISSPSSTAPRTQRGKGRPKAVVACRIPFVDDRRQVPKPQAYACAQQNLLHLPRRAHHPQRWHKHARCPSYPSTRCGETRGCTSRAAKHELARATVSGSLVDLNTDQPRLFA